MLIFIYSIFEGNTLFLKNYHCCCYLYVWMQMRVPIEEGVTFLGGKVRGSGQQGARDQI